MRPDFARVAVKWMSVTCLVAVLCSLGLDGLARAQSPAGSKRKLSQQSLLSPRPVASGVSAHRTKPNAPPPVTTETWTGSGSNSDWSNASNWNNGAIASGENILINLTTAATVDDASFTIGNLTLSNAGDSVTTNSGVTLTVGSGISNAGTIAVGNNSFLNVTGNITNSGAMTLNSTGNATELVLNGNVVLSGGGTLTLSNNAQNYIFGSNSLFQLTNQETIQGAGQIGHAQMALVNSGTINANQSAGMTIDANDGLTNTGTIEATSGATLALASTSAINTGGTISANAGIVQVNSSTINGGNVTVTGAGQLQLNTATIEGGTITNSATGTILIASGTNLLGGTINNSAGGLLNIANNVTLDLQGGTYTQLGAVQINSTGNFSELVLEGNVTLSRGSVTLSNNSQNYIFGQVATDTLTNQETISGAGQIGHGQMTLVNSGTINSNQSAGMTIQANGGITNTGTLEATSGSTLALTSTGVVSNTGGTISANTGTIQVNSSTVNGGTITLTGASALQLNTATISGGTITNSSSGTFDIASGGNVLAGTINNSAGGLFEISNNASLVLQGGTYAQLGTVQLNSTGNFTELILDGNVTLSGGTVTLSNNSQNYIFGQNSADTLTNQETISGAGQIGHGVMTLVNTGTINSNQSAGMTIQASGGVTNTGTMEATGGATLAMASTTVNNVGGTIAANTGTLQLNSSVINAGNVTLTGASTLQLNTATIHGGSTITNSSTGTIDIASGSNVLGGTINNSAGGLFEISNNASVALQGGTYSQLGTAQLNSSGNFTELILDGNVTLSGGTVTLSNNSQNYIFGQNSADTLTNQETIQGAGQIGHGVMTLVNSGTINSNQSAGLTIQANGGVTNTGTLEATSGAILALSSSGTVNNTGGTITANTGTLQVTSSIVNGGTVSLVGASALQLNSATVHGGTLINSSTGTISTVGGTSVLGGTINNSAGGLIEVGNNTTLDLENGTYSQLGAVQLNSSGNFTELVIEGNATVNGTITMSANANNYILGAISGDVLTNQGTIQGAGNIGNGGMGLVNSGTIIANASGNLLINVSGMNFNNTGTIEANGATLTLEGPGVTFFTNDNQSTATLTGGTYIANGSNIQWNAGSNNITTLAANVTEEGGGELVNTCTGTGCNSNMLAGLTSITSAGALTIGGVTFTDAGAFSNAGSLTLLPAESFTVGSLTQISGSSLTAGTYVLDANLNLSGTAQTITTNATTLTLAGGTIENTSNSTNALAGLATNTGKLTIGGSSNNVSTTATTFSNTGTLTINGGDSFNAAKLTQISGTTLSGGTYVLGGNLNLSTAGISIATNSATLTLQGGTINSNGVNALSALASNTKSLTLANNANLTTATTGNFTNSGTMSVSKGSTLTVGGTGHSYNQTAGTTTVDGSLTGNANVTGGTIQGAGTVSGNLSAGNATGTAVTINVGDAGKAGLLSITGTYAQLATGTMKASVGGATVGTQYSQVKITGAASLGGTLTAALINSFTPTVGQTFTILTASSVTGTFTNTTIAINSNEHFVVSYTSTSVVLTVASGTASKSGSTTSTAMAAVATKPTVINTKPVVATSGLRHAANLVAVNRAATKIVAKRILVTGLGDAGSRSKLVVAKPIWERSPMLSSWNHVPVVTHILRAATENLAGGQLESTSNLVRAIGTHSAPIGLPVVKPLPVRIFKPFIPRQR